MRVVVLLKQVPDIVSDRSLTPTGMLERTPTDAVLNEIDEGALETALRAVPGELTVDLLGGLPSDAGSPLLPGVELAAVRAANCGGRPSPARVAHAVTDTGRRIGLFGHRGVAGGHLRDAARELAAAPERYRDLVTHVAGLDEAAEIMGHLALHRDRVWRGRRLVKLAVRVAADRTRPTVAA